MVIEREISAIKAVTVIDPESGKVLENSDIEIERGLIKSIVPAKNASNPGEFNGNGLFAIPGIIDSHVHSLGFMDENIPGIFDLRWIFRQQRKNFAAYLRSGVTTIRDMGSALKLIRKKSIQAAQRKIEAPRILYAGPLFTVPKGYPYYAPNMPFFLKWFAGPLRIDLKPQGEDFIKRAVNDVIKAGASCIKIGYQSAEYDDDRTKIPVIDLSALATITVQAHVHGLPVAIHHTFRDDLQNLLESGINFDSLEHITTDAELSNAEIENIVQRGIPVSSTLMTYGITSHVHELESLIKGHPELFEKKPIQFFNQMIAEVRSDGSPMRAMSKNYLKTAIQFMRINLKKLHDAGVKIVFATDSGIMSPPGCPMWELKAMIHAGMAPLEALRAATSVAADVIKMPELGRLQSGKIADVVLLRGNPLNRIEAVGEVAAVVQNGILAYDGLENDELGR